MKSASVYQRLGLLAVGFLLRGAAANPFAEQQYLAGSEGPHGYSNEEYRKAINVPTKSQSRILPTIDVTDPNYSNSPMDGWGLGVKLSQNVPFPEDNPERDGGSKVFDAATLFLTPSRRELADGLRSWFLCSAVWANGLSEAALAGATGERGTGRSSCQGMLSDECVTEMSRGFTSADFCQNQTMPRACAPFLANGTDGVTRGAFLPMTIGDIVSDTEGSTFYSAATGPIDRGNATAFEAVRTWVFPVVLSWTPRVVSAAPSFVGTPEGDTRTFVACVSFAAASNGSDGEVDGGKQRGDGIGNGSSRASGGVLWLLVGALAACWGGGAVIL
ncbi:hypothetical protein QBC34DRAFT_473086 [Podospora aff. communis PSN243]|uniref:Uncharacterized protein n=1 Tax=Podospora aff. communis PSN243 TaxID=3040156 RepID=A0AAV9GCT7_9PEZI|nr:hypothetical protein QBC34DRAFT_473086 [Podospora aff. communis PSN243]